MDAMFFRTINPSENRCNLCKINTSPLVIPDIETSEIDGQTVAVMTIGEFPVKPISYKGRYYKRVTNSNHPLSVTEIANMHLHSLQLSWDAYENVGVTLNDLETTKIERFVNQVNESGRFQLHKDWQMSLEKLRILKEGKPTHSAILLFGKEPPPYNIHIGRFETPSMIIDDKMIRATLFEAVEECMKYIISHLKVAFEFTGEIQRNEIFEYPISAIRELVLNAVVHRDYTSPGDIQIKIFDKAVTFFNPGNLYDGLTVDQLKKDHYQSRIRNKLIAEAFYLTKDIEKYGSGYIRVRKEIAAYPTMEFEYTELGNGYLVTLNYEEQKISGGVSGGVNELHAYIKTHPGGKTLDFMDAFGVSKRTMERWLKQLKDENQIEFRGSPKKGGYFLKTL